MNMEEKVKKLTLEQKASLCSGSSHWETEEIPEAGIPRIRMADGPHGIRKEKMVNKSEELGLSHGVEAVCFPAAVTQACSFDRELIRKMGEALGEECQAEDVAILLGPGVNLKRSPLCGRNFEYYSEDPYLAGELAAELVKGIQSQGVGACVKHFAANNQEYRRMSVSVNADERTLRELYLRVFEIVVKKAEPWSLMCSYNRINGVYSCENPWLLDKVLRKEWGFEGFVMTDWGAMNDRVKALEAGLELEMPYSGNDRDRQLVRAVENGFLEESVLDRAVGRLLKKVFAHEEQKAEGASYDMEKHHQLARRVAAESGVLLKNDGVLPLRRENKVAFLGEFALNPRYQGGGSSRVNSFRVSSAVKAAEQEGYTPVYGQGYWVKTEEVDPYLQDEAVRLALEADTAVIFAGLPDSFESEGYDRTHLRMPENQNRLIEAVAAVQPKTVVVLYNGSPIEMPWLSNVQGVLEMYMGGEAVGEATVDLLYGTVNPCGKLAETFPLRLEDTPAYPDYAKDPMNADYGEGLFIGYRHYDIRKLGVLFPFGHGLSYTTFQYSNLRTNADEILDDTEITV